MNDTENAVLPELVKLLIAAQRLGDPREVARIKQEFVAADLPLGFGVDLERQQQGGGKG